MALSDVLGRMLSGLFNAEHRKFRSELQVATIQRVAKSKRRCLFRSRFLPLLHWTWRQWSNVYTMPEGVLDFPHLLVSIHGTAGRHRSRTPALSASLPSADAFCGNTPNTYTCLSGVVLRKIWLAGVLDAPATPKQTKPLLGHQPARQPHHFNVAPSLSLRLPARLNSIEIAVDVELQRALAAIRALNEAI